MGSGLAWCAERIRHGWVAGIKGFGLGLLGFANRLSQSVAEASTLVPIADMPIL